MAYERLFLCGGSTQPKGTKYPTETTTVSLLLWGKRYNITLKISDLSQKMVSNLPDLYADLLEIATYIYCADQTTTRGGSGAMNIGANWRRNMHFIIPVRKPDFWSKQEVVATLEDTLSFLSDDNYEFNFVKLSNPPEIDNYFEFPQEERGFVPNEIISFSGGLDSLAGAIQEIFVDHNPLALVSHRSAPKIAPKQKELYNQICSQCGKDLKPLHIPVWIHKHGLCAPEESQRSRSFLYATLAATVATMFGRDRIRFYENGITSLNLPISEQVLGARATRTTHPKSRAGFEKLFSLMNDSAFAVEIPFFWKTKTDVVDLIKSNDKVEMIKRSVSCSRIFAMTRLNTHCGCCTQCIDRRLAIFAADSVKYDPDEMYTVNVFKGERTKGQDLTLAESFVRTMRDIPTMSEAQFFGKYGEVSRAIPYIEGGSDDVAAQIFSLFKRNGEQVQTAIKNAVKYYSEDFGKGDLPDRCLFRQLFGSKALEVIVSDVSRGRKKRRPTAAEMENRNRAVTMAAVEIKGDYGRLPSVSEIIDKTELTAEQIYATVPYKEGKIARRSAKLTTESTGSSVTESEQFGGKSIEHSRADRLSKSEQLERDQLIDESKADDANDEKQYKRYLRNKNKIDTEE
ncbi:MAG: hypothetical protein ACYSWZ_00360 [Planctomycetota bacterium]|jgi:hypothetical protein